MLTYYYAPSLIFVENFI
uniref:Uncharacterized protein n=1 Tax=Oryza glumipatula TaxID=40148 RepID=A0A0D9YXR4_9ORYZ